jgi:hypothetical protein
MSCAVFTLLGLYALIAHKSSTWMIYATLLAAVLFFLWSAFLGWRDEYRARMQGDASRPILVLNAHKIAGSAPRKWSLTLQNCGNRVARFVRMESVASRGTEAFRLWFSQIPVLKSGTEEHLAFWATRGFSEEATLEDFLNDHTDDAALIWWDIEATFRDMDETTGKELVRLCYDVESDALWVAAVPYTEKNLAKNA